MADRELVLHSSATDIEATNTRSALVEVVAESHGIISQQKVESLRQNREEHRHKQIWIKDAHGGPYRKAKSGDGYDPLMQNEDGTPKKLELGYVHPVETGPTSNFVGNHMTQGAIDLVQAELGQKSLRTLRLKGSQHRPDEQQLPIQQQQSSSARPILIEQSDVRVVEAVKPFESEFVGPIIAVAGGRPELAVLRKAVRRQRSR